MVHWTVSLLYVEGSANKLVNKSPYHDSELLLQMLRALWQKINLCHPNSDYNGKTGPVHGKYQGAIAIHLFLFFLWFLTSQNSYLPAKRLEPAVWKTSFWHLNYSVLPRDIIVYWTYILLCFDCTLSHLKAHNLTHESQWMSAVVDGMVHSRQIETTWIVGRLAHFSSPSQWSLHHAPEFAWWRPIVQMQHH